MLNFISHLSLLFKQLWGDPSLFFKVFNGFFQLSNVFFENINLKLPLCRFAISIIFFFVDLHPLYSNLDRFTYCLFMVFVAWNVVLDVSLLKFSIHRFTTLNVLQRFIVEGSNSQLTFFALSENDFFYYCALTNLALVETVLMGSIGTVGLSQKSMIRMIQPRYLSFELFILSP